MLPNYCNPKAVKNGALEGEFLEKAGKFSGFSIFEWSSGIIKPTPSHIESAMIRPMVTLRPMTGAEFSPYLEAAIPAYAHDKVAAGNWPEAGALERARQDFSQLLHSGVDTEGHHLYSILEDGRRVGILWVAALDQGGTPGAFIYDFEIAKSERGRGLGRAALEALEPVVRALGCKTISLHVFGHNETARHLYERAGFIVTNLNMTKQL